MTPLLLVKLRRDLQTIWPRIVLMILAMSFTLIVFSAVLYTRGITGREMSRAYLSTSPASATLLFERGLDLEQMKVIVAEARKQPGILEATARTQLTLQVQQENGEWGANPLQMFIAPPDDPMQLETFTVLQGSWPPEAGEILINRTSFDLLNLEVGGTVVVQAPNGTPTSLRVTGAVYDPALAPSFQEQKGHGFLSTASLPFLGEPITLDALKIQVADAPGLITPSRNREVIVATARELADWLQQSYGVIIQEIQIPTPYAHPHQRQADLLLGALVVFGLAGLLLSAILVATMLSGMFVQQIPQIGMMKAIGASSGNILQVYLLMTLLIAAIATILAIVPGILMSRTLAPTILNLLGIEASSVAAPGWMIVVVVALGIGVPLLFSLASIIRTSRTTVRAALDYRGVDRNAMSRFGAWLGRLGSVNRTVLLAFRNIFRRRARLVLSVGLLAGAGTVFIAGMSTMSSIQAIPEQTKALQTWDVDVQLANTNQSAVMITGLVAQLPQVTKVEAWSIVPSSLAQPGAVSVTNTYPDQGHGSMPITVIPPDTSLMAVPALLEGRWLRPDETTSIVITQSVSTKVVPNIRSGNTIQLTVADRATRWQVVGIVAPAAFQNEGVFMTQAGYQAAANVTQPNVLRIVTASHNEETRASVAAAVQRTLTDASVTVRSSASVSRTAAASAGHMLPIIVVFLGLSIAMGVVGFVGLASTISTSVLERTREFGVMSAIGARASTIRTVVVTEGIFTALLSCLVAILPTLLLTAVMSAGFGKQFLNGPLPFQISLSAVLVWIVVVVLGATLATLAPASRAPRLSVREALAYL